MIDLETLQELRELRKKIPAQHWGDTFGSHFSHMAETIEALYKETDLLQKRIKELETK